MITLAFGQMVYFILVSLQFYGGDDGLMISARNTLPGINLESPLVFYYVPGAADGLDAPVHAHHQLALRHGAAGAAPERAARAESGRGAHAVPSGAFVLSAVGTGLAGVLWANYAGLVTPDMAAWTKSGELMAIVILGGVGTLLGPIAGAAVFLGLEQVLTSLTEHWLLYMGPILVLVVLCGQRACSAASWRRAMLIKLTPEALRASSAPRRTAEPDPRGPGRNSRDGDAAAHGEAGALLRLSGLRKAFDAVVATNGVDLDVRAGEIHAIIGPNGAGKSTLIAQICGEIRPDSGSIHLDGRDVTALRAFERARLGLGRSFQITELCQEYTALENVILSCMLKTGRAFQLWSDPRRDAGLKEQALGWLEHVGLRDRRHVRTADLAHGEKRQLELAVALARSPRLLLLDEPMAGMGPEESARMTRLLQGMKGQYGILLVEHDMDAVFALADRISVLVYGKVVFSGPPDAVRRHPEVRAAYLGEESVGEARALGEAHVEG